jgi:hypothetical protein
MHFYFPGMIVGIIILQTSIVAPTLFKKLEISDFGRAIRALWPKFFIMLTILGGITLAILHFGHDATLIEYSIAGATTLFAAIFMPLFRQQIEQLTREIKRNSISFTKQAST